MPFAQYENASWRVYKSPLMGKIRFEILSGGEALVWLDLLPDVARELAADLMVALIMENQALTSDQSGV